MIQAQLVEVVVAIPTVTWFRNLGYDVKRGSKIEVPPSHLQRGSSCQIQVVCDGCSNIFPMRYLRAVDKTEHLCLKCRNLILSKRLQTDNIVKHRKTFYMPSGENHPRWNPKKSELQAYTRKVHWLTKKTYDKYKALINPLGFPRTLCGTDGGYQLDHIISIREGFERQILPEILSEKENLQMLTWKENRTKHCKTTQGET